MSLALSHVLGILFLPPLAPLLLICLGLLLHRWRPRLGWVLSWCGVVLTLLSMLPASVDMALRPLERVAPPLLDMTLVKEAQAIVILGGGRQTFAPEYGKPTVNGITLERLRYGAHLARVTGLPIMVSGGLGEEGDSEAEMMAEVLTGDFGVKPKWLEDRSATTAENARYSAAMLKHAGINRIVLVTHAAHMRRALGYFTATGLQVTPAPTAFLLPATYSNNSLMYPPSANSAFAGWYAAHEWAGLIKQRLTK